MTLGTLNEIRAAAVIIINPIYEEDIVQNLVEYGLNCRPVTCAPSPY